MVSHIGLPIWHSMKTVKILDLFAGIGGLSGGVLRAFQNAGVEATIVGASEIKKPAIAVLEANNHSGNIMGDITTIQESDVPAHDLLLAGFPCQAFSKAGTRKGFEDTRGTLFFDVARILKHHQPERFILENVANIIVHDPYPRGEVSPYGEKVGRTLTVILDTLTGLGYEWEWKLLNSEDFGVPQSRERIFIYGSKKPLPATGITPHEGNKVLLGDIIDYGNLPHDETPKEVEFRLLLEEKVGVGALAGKNINDKRGGDTNIHSWTVEAKGPISADGKALMDEFLLQRRKKHWAVAKGQPNKDGVLLSADDIATFYKGDTPLDTLLGELVERRYLRIQEGDYNLGSGRLSFPYSRIYGADEVTVTATATDTNRMGVVDGDHIRRFLPVEYKRLFGFDDDYVLPESLKPSQIYDLFGNSVVVPVAEAVTNRLYGFK